MYKKLFSWMLVIAAIAFVPATTFGQISNPTEGGLIIVAKATGNVTAVGPDGQTITLKKGSELTQGYVVQTGDDSSVILAFSNGATINLAQDSSLSIDEFLQDPFSDEVALAELTAEPTTSTTKLHLSRGELVGNVKKLNSDAGSSFVVQTPVGAAGIRGTTFRIVFRPDGTGKAFFSLTTVEGNVVLSSGTMDLPSGISVSDNNEVVVLVDVDVDPSTGAITVSQAPATPVTVTETRPTTQAEVTAVAQEVATAAATVVFSPATSVSKTTTTTTTNDEGDEGDEGDEETTATTTKTNDEGEKETTVTATATQDADRTTTTTTTTTTTAPATPATPRTTTGDGSN